MLQRPLITAVVILFFKRKKFSSEGSLILLVGSPDAGKTAILTALVYKQPLPTNTSLQSNSATFNLRDSRVERLVDIPGHPRIRSQFREFIPLAKAVVFVVDSSTVARIGASVAEYLHEVLQTLSSLPPSAPTPALLVLANKSDLLSSGTASARVRTVLERELTKRQENTGVAVSEETEEDRNGGLDCSGPPGFRFADWEGGNVGFASSSVQMGASQLEKTGTDGLDSLKDWLESL